VLAHDDEHGTVTVPTVGAGQKSGYMQWRKMRTLANEIALPMRD
jgi:hypothetical protein